MSLYQITNGYANKNLTIKCQNIEAENLDLSSITTEVVNCSNIFISTNKINGSLSIPISNIVGISDSQTLTNKIMDYNLNTFENFPAFGSTQYFFNRSIPSSYGYAEMSTSPVQTAQTSLTATGTGTQQLEGVNCSGFITPMGIPNLTSLNPGIWAISMQIAMSSNGGTPTIFPALYKISNLGVETLISDGSLSPTPINQGTVIYDYIDNLVIPYIVMDRNDRFVIKFFAQDLDARTMTMYFEGNTISYAESSVATVNAIQSINGLYPTAQYIKIGTTGNAPNVSSIGASHTINIPNASTTASGIITTGNQSFAGYKTFFGNVNIDNRKIYQPSGFGDYDYVIIPDVSPFFEEYTLLTDRSVQTVYNKTISTSLNIITPASSSNSGIITTGNQSFLGEKTFDQYIIAAQGLKTNGIRAASGSTVAISSTTSYFDVYSDVDSTSSVSPASLRTLGGLSVTKTINTNKINANASSIFSSKLTVNGSFISSGLNTFSNTTESTSTTSNSAIKTSGGISVAKSINASAIYGKNNLTAYYCGSFYYNGTQSVTSGVQTRLILDTTVFNPSSMTTTFTPANYTVTLNKTGKYLIQCQTYAFMNPGTGTFQGFYLYNSGTLLSFQEFRFNSQNALNINYVGQLTSGTTLYLEGQIQGTSPSFSSTMNTRMSIVFLGI